MYQGPLSYANLDEEMRHALDEAERAMQNAYNPYSNFYVGAALYGDAGSVVSGANFENASYGLTICAERSAVVRANARGMRVFRGIAIIARHENFDTKEPTFPCGSCRQVLFEISQISEHDLLVIVSNTRKDMILNARISELLLAPFGPKDIGIDLSKYRKS